MKKSQTFLILLFTAFLSYTPVSAQLFFGLEGGARNPLKQSTAKAGVLAEFPVHRFVFLHPEFFYIGKETAINIETTTSEDDFRFTQVNYLELPITAHLKLTIELVSFKIFMGPYIAYGLNAFGITEDNNGKENFTLEEVDISRFDYGATVGGGLDFAIAKGKKMFIDVRFSLGFKDISTLETNEVYNEGHSVTIGLMLPMKKQEKDQ